MELVENLRGCGFVVDNCLVVFEPVGKDARAKLAEKGVTLFSILEGPSRIDG